MSQLLITTIASIIVAFVAGLTGWAAQRQSAKASVKVSRLDLEKEAYDRARAYDTETINRQDREIEEIRKELETFRLENLALRQENHELRTRVYQLEIVALHRRSPDNGSGENDAGSNGGRTHAD